VGRLSEKMVGAENRRVLCKKRAMRCTSAQIHRPCCSHTNLPLAGARDLTACAACFDTAKTIEQSTWHARAAIPASQIGLGSSNGLQSPQDGSNGNDVFSQGRPWLGTEDHG
jgi:hypothetical protein